VTKGKRGKRGLTKVRTSSEPGPVALAGSAIAVHLPALRNPTPTDPYARLATHRLILYHRLTAYPKHSEKPAPAPQGDKDEKKISTIMQPERTDLDPPKNAPFTQEQLKEYDGTDASKPVYVAIKGTIVCSTAWPHNLAFSCYPSFALTLERAYTYTCIFVQERFSTCHGSAKRTGLVGHTQYWLARTGRAHLDCRA
jgi:hypothetical protein